MRALLAALAAVVAAARAQCDTEPSLTAEIYDAWPYDPASLGLSRAPITPHTCDLAAASGRYDGTAVEVAQLFEPPAVPWVYRKVCLRGFVDGTVVDDSAVAATVAFYEPNPLTGFPADKPLANVSATFGRYDTWYNIDVAVQVSARRVYIALRIALPCATFSYYYFPYLPGRPSFWRNPADSAPKWAMNRADWASDNISVVSLRAAGARVPSGVPSGWRCASSLYNDKQVCNCECGAWDPDCHHDVKGPASPNCTAGVCNRAGKCQDPAWSKCPLASFGSGDGCQCGCGGVLDPDCRDLAGSGGPWYPAALSCTDGVQGAAFCTDSDTCSRAWPGNRTSATPDGYCNCVASGFLDPDCSCTRDKSSLVCVSTASTCGGLKCVSGGCRGLPAEWRCGVNQYADGKKCQCNCGSPDPDCIPINGALLPVEGCPLSTQICSLNASTCIESKCDNGVVESSEECDGGQGCARCKCKSGWVAKTPLARECRPQCGDGFVAPIEACDGGAYCFKSNCTCYAGHLPYSPPRKSCQGCGNGVVDAGESCDSGPGCDPTSCVCLFSYEPTTPPTVGCKKLQFMCGDGNLHGSEQCDSGKFCDNCTCVRGHSPYAPPARSCSGCGNGVYDEGEQCDGGLGCNASCLCPAGYAPTDPPTANCLPLNTACGNGIVNTGEDCDGGLFCSACKCARGHAPYAPPDVGCAGCGNGVVDEGEECDAGAGCDANCTCGGNGGLYAATLPATRGCRRARESNATASRGNDISVQVGVPVGVVCCVVLVMGCVVGLVYATRKRRQAPGMMMESPLGGPEDPHAGVVIASASAGPQMASLGMEAAGGSDFGAAGPIDSAFGMHYRSHAPDGTPIIIVPVKADFMGVPPPAGAPAGLPPPPGSSPGQQHVVGTAMYSGTISSDSSAAAGAAHT
eukprot:m51a1_g14425 putative protein kinase domain containing protein (913) ;mRNA; r:501289-504818